MGWIFGMCFGIHTETHMRTLHLVRTRARFWFRRGNCGNTRSPCLDKPMVPSGMYHRTHVADVSQPYSSKHHNTKHFSSCA